MFNSFKYLELMRHHIFVKMKKMIGENTKCESQGFDKLTEVIFSSALSLFITYLSEIYFKNGNDNYCESQNIFVSFFKGIGVYIGLYFLIRLIYNVSRKIFRYIFYKMLIHSPDVSVQKAKELIDDFDHIAFDNLIISYEFLNKIEESTNSEVRTFYFHEILYYLRISVNKTKEITHRDRRKNCLNIFGNVNGVDIFRLVNAHKMMCELYEKIKMLLDNNEISNSIQIYDDKLKQALLFQINQLNSDIIEIGTRCDQAMADMKPIF